ncbi:MAG: transcriptional regulator, partial [Flavobacteriaceae bacterium]|nr:transcriptional regulator [Flavobacteriaceae bacterium]
MKKIQMVDLQGQYREIQSEVNERFTSVLESAAFINGPEVQEFQKA